jgi:2-dehydro-3-deoxyphosphooctonate aldolase (KDO 8-P synthase)
MNSVSIGKYTISEGKAFTLIAGPCVLEGYDRSILIGRKIKDICKELKIQYIFKASYDKANRTSYNSFRGPGLKEGLRILDSIKKELQVPILSDVHETCQIDDAASVLDVIQIPAFLCRQTDLIWQAAKTGLPVNVKKGQFLSPTEMRNVVRKIEEAGNNRILITERGTTFGYNNLVVDMRSIAILKTLGYPVVFDGTHSVQLPGADGDKSSGQRQFIPILCNAAIAAGANALFLEVHDNPDEALSDGPNMVILDELQVILERVLKVYNSLGGENERN